jgi:hypothetical protein
MKILLILGGVWYWWRLYSLSFNPSMFPDRKYADAVWERRSNRSFFLGAAVSTALLRVLGAVQTWWAMALTSAICLVALAFVQPLLVGTIILLRAGLVLCKIKVGVKLRSPMLAPFAWTYYLTEEEKRSAMKDGG